MSSCNPLLFSLQRVSHLLASVSRVQHSSRLPGQPYNSSSSLKETQSELSHLVSCHGYELECYLLKSLFSYALEMCRDERNVLKLANDDPQARIFVVVVVVVVVVVYVSLQGYLLRVQLLSVYRRHNFVSLLSHSFYQACCQVFNDNSTLATVKMDKNALSALNKVSHSFYLLFLLLLLLLLSLTAGPETVPVPHVCPLPVPPLLPPPLNTLPGGGSGHLLSASPPGGPGNSGMDS